jgi:hypothetical protein
MPEHPPDPRTSMWALLVAALLLTGFATVSRVEPVRGARAPCQNTGHAPCR